ncbi:MAG: acetolactate synthase [Chloroflexi bacterium]|nr:MAG: acetolactate synthase [Chloroflexota bacterium]TMD73500.1 MAG: acetolactate synthase [Chloroflexota bacterium]
MGDGGVRVDSGNAGELVALALKRAGVSHLFTLNGGHIWPVLMGAEEHGIRIIDTRHEQSAAFAAEGWAKVTRECGVAAVTAGPGVTNSASALAQAQGNDSPMFVIGGRAPVARWGMGSLQEMDHVEVVRSLTKKSMTLGSAEDAYMSAAECMRTALSRRTGPVFMDVPLDVFFGAADLPEATEHLTPDPGPPPDPDQIERAARLIREADRPVVVAGGGVWWARAEEGLRTLVEAGMLPLTVNGMARGMLPPSHPLYFSRARSQALREADLIVLAGVLLDFRLNFGQPPVFGEDVRLIYLDVDDHRKHRPGEVSIFGNLKASIGQLAAALGAKPDRGRWVEALRETETAGRRSDAAMAQADGSPVHPARLIAEVDSFADPDAIIVGDGGDFVSFAGRLIERQKPGLWVDPGPFGCLGSGPGYAMAAKLARPDRQVILLSGDGAFGFSAMEFDTMVRHRIPVVCLIGNNGIWALEKHPMQSMLGASIAADLGAKTRYDKVVEALGGYGEMVERPDEIRPALERAFKSGLPACINVICDPNAEYPRSSVLM